MEKISTYPKCQYIDGNDKNIIHEGVIIGETASEFLVVLKPDNPHHGEGEHMHVEKNRVHEIEHTDEEIIASARRELLTKIKASEFSKLKVDERINFAIETSLGHGEYTVQFTITRRSDEIQGFHISDGEITRKKWI